MPPCKNDRSKQYDGTEPSPRGAGYSASADPVGRTRRGLDGARYCVAQDKNGRKAWRKQGGGSLAATGTRRTVPLMSTQVRRPQMYATQRPAVLQVQGIRAPLVARADVSPYVTQRLPAPTAPMATAPCLGVDDLRREIDTCLDEMLPPGSSECARTLACLACVAGAKMATSTNADAAAAADKVLSVALASVGGKPFGVAETWDTIAKKAASAMAVTCVGADRTAVAAANAALS